MACFGFHFPGKLMCIEVHLGWSRGYDEVEALLPTPGLFSPGGVLRSFRVLFC